MKDTIGHVVDPQLPTTRRNRRISEVSVDDKDYLKMTAEACLKLEKDSADSCGKLRACATLTQASSEAPEADSERAHCLKHTDYISDKKKDMWEVKWRLKYPTPKPR